MLLFGAVALVLLIVCINLMNLMLVRASARRREWAIRFTMGRGTSTPSRRAGGRFSACFYWRTVGLLLSTWLLALVRATAPFDLPRTDELHVNPPALAFAVGVSISAQFCLAFGPHSRGGPTRRFQRVLRVNCRAAPGTDPARHNRRPPVDSRPVQSSESNGAVLPTAD